MTHLPQRWLTAAFLLAVLLAGCSRTPGQPPVAATIERPKVESDLAWTTLSPQAVQSLGIRSEAIRSRPVQEHVQRTGWVMPRQGNEVTVTAPVAGYVREPAETGRARLPPSLGPRLGGSLALPVPGTAVEKEQQLLALEPVLSPVEQIQLAALKRGVESELAKARESVTVAESEVKRVLDLHRQGLRGQQDVEQAQVRLKHAQEDQAAAQDKRKLFPNSDGAEGSAHLKAITIRAPRAGTVLAVHVSPGQYVPAAAPLVVVADLSQLWLRVPVSEPDLPQVDRQQSAPVVVGGQKSEVRSQKSEEERSFLSTQHSALSTQHSLPRFDARPVALVPQVDTARHTADLIYELPSSAAKQGIVAKDQMVTVFVPLRGRREESVVPYSAVIFDAYGGTWIYFDQTTNGSPDHIYERRRVELGPAVDEGVVIRPTGKTGERVVTAGAAALFSREFHKPPLPAGAPRKEVDDDD